MKIFPILLFSIIALVTFDIATNAQKRQLGMSPLCKITKSQLPKIRGLYLGMSVDEFRKLYPPIIMGPEAKNGVAVGLYSPSYFNDKVITELQDIFSLDLSFYKGRLFYFWIYYNNYEVSSYQEHMKNISKSLNLPYRWNLPTQTMTCEGFSVGAPVYGRAGLVVDDLAVEKEIKKQESELKQAEMQKKAADQKRRSIFRP
jgi:hypothetical protein